MEISVRLRAKQKAGIDDATILALGAQRTSERQYLSREEFAAKAGASPADVAKIDDFAHRQGLNVKSVHLASRTVKLTGTVKAFSAAFGVSLAKVKQGAATYRMRTGSVNIPADLKDIVVGVHGLDNRPCGTAAVSRQQRDRPPPRQNPRRGTRHGTLTADGSFAVTDIAKLYNFPTAQDGAGQCIAIIELNDLDGKGRPTAPAIRSRT